MYYEKEDGEDIGSELVKQFKDYLPIIENVINKIHVFQYKTKVVFVDVFYFVLMDVPQ